MKVSVLQENLQKGVSLVERFVASKTELPVLSNVLLEAKEGHFTMRATNLNTGIRFRVGGKVVEEGAVTVPAKVLGEFVGALLPGKVDLDASQDELKVLSGTFSATFQGIGAGEFPEFPKKGSQKAGEVDMALLERVVEKVSFAASSDDSRPVLTGVLWDLKTKKRLVATDGYRLSLLNLEEGGVTLSGIEETLLLPAQALREAVRVFDEVEGKNVEVYLSQEQKQVFFEMGDVEIVLRLLEGEFPDYNSIIPKQSELEVVLQKDELLRAVKLAAIFARESANIVRWTFSKQGLVVSANSAQLGKSSTTVSIEGVVGSEKQIAFNSRYLLDFLSKVGEESIQFGMSDALQPGVFTEFLEGKKKGLVHVIMPVRVQD